MFLNPHERDYYKRSRRSRVKKVALSSRISLISGLTTSSGDSSGSTATITQESISRSSRPLRRASTMRTYTRKDSSSSSSPTSSSRRDSKGSLPDNIDVFDFLDKGQAGVLDPNSANQSNTVTQDCRIRRPSQDESDMESTGRSFHSDSGISVRDSSPESHSYSPRPKKASNVLREDQESEEVPISMPRVGRGRFSFTSRWRSLLEPAIEITSDQGNSDESPPPEEFYAVVGKQAGSSVAHANPVTQPIQSDPREVMSFRSGYDLLSLCLGGGGCVTEQDRLPALYRKFSRLNHRILLHLQDEISQMEEDLARLDEADAQCRQWPDGRPIPESRRMQWQWPGSDLHAARSALLGQIYVKVEQYSMF